MKRETPESALAGAGVHVAGEEKPDVITLDLVQQWCAKEERILRLQYRTSPDDPGTLPAEWETGLAHRGRQPTTMHAALSRWAYLLHLWRVRSGNLTKASAEEAQDTVRRLLQRTPILVELPSKTVHITARSYNAMLEIARHSLRLQEIDADMRRLAEMEQQVIEGMVRQGKDTPRKVRRRKRIQWLYQIHRKLLLESRMHRQAIYAHAFTPSGAPATELEDAPEWWEELTPEDDLVLLQTMFAVGHGRLSQVPERPEKDDDAQPKEDWGWHGLLTSLERQAKVEPASYYDRDLFQLVTWMRTSQPDFDFDD